MIPVTISKILFKKNHKMNTHFYKVSLFHLNQNKSPFLVMCLNSSGWISIKARKNQSSTDELVFFSLFLHFAVRTFTFPVDHACLNVDPLTWLNVSGSTWPSHHCSAASCLGASGGCSFLTASGFDLWSLFFTDMSKTLTVIPCD